MSDSVRPRRWQPTRLPRSWDSPGKNTGVGCHFLLQCMKVKSESEVAQSRPTRGDPLDCSPPGSFIHGIFQARVLEWGAIAFSGKCITKTNKCGTIKIIYIFKNLTVCKLYSSQKWEHGSKLKSANSFIFFSREIETFEQWIQLLSLNPSKIKCTAL